LPWIGITKRTLKHLEAIQLVREIDEHRIPIEREVVAALAHAPGVLDFYVWLVWKSWAVNGRPASIPLVAEHGLNEQLGSAEYVTAKTLPLQNQGMAETGQVTVA
jgi:hypothetical protein